MDEKIVVPENTKCWGCDYGISCYNREDIRCLPAEKFGREYEEWKKQGESNG